MSSNPFFCKECQMDFADYLDVKLHISLTHLDCFPYKCLTCKARGIKYETISSELMEEHTSAVHQGTDEPDVRFSTTEENKLRFAIENCRRPSVEQVTPNDSKNILRRVFISLGGTLADIENIGDENMSTSTETKHEKFDSRIPPVFSIEPIAVDETHQNVADPVDSDNTLALNARMSTKEQSADDVSTVPIGLRLETALSSYVPIDVEANEDNEALDEEEGTRPTPSKRQRFAEKDTKKFIQLAAKAKALMAYEQLNPRQHARTSESGANQFYAVVMEKCGIKKVVAIKRAKKAGNRYHRLIECVGYQSKTQLRRCATCGEDPAGMDFPVSAVNLLIQWSIYKPKGAPKQKQVKSTVQGTTQDVDVIFDVVRENIIDGQFLYDATKLTGMRESLLVGLLVSGVWSPAGCTE
ncbi:hypothetical protein DdX_16820 [Ditylenchus destructor]|uniref:C2H2-type domain-containing protein n=1 Tax=Ditylenchus destructor TaxID=166010 RepID=A0AAD4QWC8_9BILA|nr:hypothetical protein DdX_16820 [Ditylenchus destructor]